MSPADEIHAFDRGLFARVAPRDPHKVARTVLGDADEEGFLALAGDALVHGVASTERPLLIVHGTFVSDLDADLQFSS